MSRLASFILPKVTPAPELSHYDLLKSVEEFVTVIYMNSVVRDIHRHCLAIGILALPQRCESTKRHGKDYIEIS
jgi:hypothetical protein